MNTNGETALILGAKNKHERLVQMLLESGLGYNNHENERGHALGAAAENGYEGVVQALIEHGSDVVNWVDFEEDKNLTAPHKAAANGHEEVVRILLRSHADVRAKDFRNDTALHKAVKINHLKIITLLLKSGAKSGLKARRGPIDFKRGA